MDVTKVAAYSSLFKDLTSLWSGLKGDDKEKLDGVLKKVIANFVPDEGLERQKNFFLTSNDILPMKIAALAMDPVVRDYVSKRVTIHDPGGATLEVTEEQLTIVKCRHCGGLQILDDLRQTEA